MVISFNFTLLWVFFRPLKLHLKLKIQVLHVFQTITHLKEIEVKFHQYHFKMSLSKFWVICIDHHQSCKSAKPHVTITGLAQRDPNQLPTLVLVLCMH